MVRYVDGPPVAWLGRCGDAHWLQVVLHDEAGTNRHGVGARVVVEAGGTTQVRWILAGGHSLSVSVPAMAHFGLGDVETVDSVVVHWPDGGLTGVQDVAASQRIAVRR